jgi:hypothetical protein
VVAPCFLCYPLFLYSYFFGGCAAAILLSSEKTDRNQWE